MNYIYIYIYGGLSEIVVPETTIENKLSLKTQRFLWVECWITNPNLIDFNYVLIMY